MDAKRQLKRNVTDAMIDISEGGPPLPTPRVLDWGGAAVCEQGPDCTGLLDGTPRCLPPVFGFGNRLERSNTLLLTSPAPGAPPMPWLPMGFPTKDSPMLGSMDPPLQPPPWKRPSLSAAAFAAAAVPATPSAPSSPLMRRPLGSPRATPRRLDLSEAALATPKRLLTPRVSWSEMAARSQESLDGDAAPGSPSTPCVRLRVRSPQTMRKQRDQRDYLAADDALDSPNFRLGQQSEGRLEREFCDVTAIGRGQFSTVYRARNCIDQAVYAVKKTTQIARQQPQQAQLREVFALANVSMEAENCPNIVRYFSSWFEDGRLHIQTELCEGSLRDRLARRGRSGRPRLGAAITGGECQEELRFATPEIVQVVRDVANGLNVLHGCNFVHLDIKPDNILVSRNRREQECYKIADLGLAVAALDSGCDDICEGDCRYLAKEVLRGDLSALPKADVFALGLVGLELATNPKPLPCNGEGWHRLRDGGLDPGELAPLAEPLVELIVQMIRAKPADRPSAATISSHPTIVPEDGLEAMSRKMKQQAAETEKAKSLANAYFQELIELKQKELLGRSAPSSRDPPRGCEVSATLALGQLSSDFSSSLGSTRCAATAGSKFGRGVRRGKTFG